MVLTLQKYVLFGRMANYWPDDVKYAASLNGLTTFLGSILTEFFGENVGAFFNAKNV